MTPVVSAFPTTGVIRSLLRDGRRRTDERLSDHAFETSQRSGPPYVSRLPCSPFAPGTVTFHPDVSETSHGTPRKGTPLRAWNGVSDGTSQGYEKGSGLTDREHVLAAHGPESVSGRSSWRSSGWRFNAVVTIVGLVMGRVYNIIPSRPGNTPRSEHSTASAFRMCMVESRGGGVGAAGSAAPISLGSDDLDGCRE